MTGDEGVAFIMTELTYISVLKRFVHQMSAEPSQLLCRLRRKEGCMSNVWQVQEAKARFSEMGWTPQLGQRRGQVKRDSRWKV